jgi:chaperonin GroEL
VFTINKSGKHLKERIKQVKDIIKKEDKNPYLKKKQEERLAILNGSVGIVYVGADSEVELKEKKDRVEDAVHATKAALKEGIVPGGGIALLNAANSIKPENIGEEILLQAITTPFQVILENANIDVPEEKLKKGYGVNVIDGSIVDMVKGGVIDPVLVTKSALKNAASVASTIISADCIISNVRILQDNESS